MGGSRPADRSRRRWRTSPATVPTTSSSPTATSGRQRWSTARSSRVTAPKLEAVETRGAGDSLTAAVTAALARARTLDRRPAPRRCRRRAQRHTSRPRQWGAASRSSAWRAASRSSGAAHRGAHEREDSPMSQLLDRLATGPVICAEGYLFEFERRGYLQAARSCPRSCSTNRTLVAQVHREFVHAGSGCRRGVHVLRPPREAGADRPRARSRDDEPPGAADRQGRRRASTARSFAGNICNTNVYEPDDADSHSVVRQMFFEQVAWAAEAGVDFVIAETFSYAAGGAAGARGHQAEAGLDAVITLAIHRRPETREGWSVGDACRRIEDAGAAVVGLNCCPRAARRCCRCSTEVRAACDGPIAALPVRTAPPRPSRRFSRSAIQRCDLDPRRPPVPHGARPVHLQPLRDGRVRRRLPTTSA